MKLLSVDSSGLVAAVALFDDGRLTAEYRTDHRKTHSQTLLPMAVELLEMTETDIGEIGAIAISAGPGSFTGLRIGAATVKGLAFENNIPIVPVPTTDAMAWQLYGEEGLICPLMDARRSQVYTGLYRFKRRFDGTDAEVSDMEILRSVCALDVGDLISEINEIGGSVVFLGDGVPVYEERIRESIKIPYRFSLTFKDRQSAAALADLGEKYFKLGISVSADTFAPMYLRPSQAEREPGDEVKSFEIKRMRSEDARDAALLEERTLGREAWTESMIREAAGRRDSIYLAAFDGGRQIGHAGIRSVCGEGEITNVCVAPDFRRRGVAMALVRGLIKRGKALGIGDITLEVRAGNNAAINLYRRLGFMDEGVRGRFYTNPPEDALIMWLRGGAMI